MNLREISEGRELHTPGRFAELLRRGDYSAAELSRTYLVFQELEADLGLFNPFRGHLQAVAAILQERYPEVWAGLPRAG